MALLTTILFIGSLLFLFAFSLAQLHLTWIYVRSKGKPEVKMPLAVDHAPAVTVQLPIYNEKHVVERLLDAVSKLDWEKSLLEIQVLDDSNDETSDIIKDKVAVLRQQGLDIVHIQRPTREGFKAGALAYALPLAKGSFIALFDADFIPPNDFLKKTIPYFSDPSIGVVQTRWGHLNEGFSLLTKLQAFALNAHFSVEQRARNVSGSLINFNGTCGVWRKQCIDDAGGWSADTLTEDLDLSYRAQLKGWKFKYLEDVVVPGELPINMPSIKSQQYRWNKGGAETTRKLLGKTWGSSLPLRAKLHAFFHLANSSVFFFLLLAGLTSVPMVYFKITHPWLETPFKAGVVFLLGFFSVAFFYWAMSRHFYGTRALWVFLTRFPPFLLLSMGLSFHNGWAVAQGWLKKKTPFIRTPKFNIVEKRGNLSGKAYSRFAFSYKTVIEGLLFLYFSFGAFLGLYWHEFSLLPFHFMLAVGYALVLYYTIKPGAHG